MPTAVYTLVLMYLRLSIHHIQTIQNKLKHPHAVFLGKEISHGGGVESEKGLNKIETETCLVVEKDIQKRSAVRPQSKKVNNVDRVLRYGG